MLNVIRHQAKLPLRRSYATAFVPPAALENVEFDRRPRGPPPKAKPVSPTFYTGRASYYDQLTSLESAITHTRSVLQNLQLLPLPKFAREALPPLQPVWKAKDSMGTVLEARLTTSRYRRVTTLLNQLNDYRRISETAGCYELAAHVANVLVIFERENKEAVLARGKRKPVEFDKYGRSYTVGRRKESTARVWMIPVQEAPATSQAPQSVQKFEPAATITENANSVQDLTPSGPISFVDPAQPVSVTSTNIIINNAPLSQYFLLPADRERIIRPFKIAGLIGAYNVFAIVRGGGTTGQSGAVSLGIAKALAAHAPEVEPLLRKAKLTRRDPRMVERKKTGLAKARKAYTWVKR